MKRKSRPQIRSLSEAVKTVEGKHNLEVVGSNPTPATILRQGFGIALLVCITRIFYIVQNPKIFILAIQKILKKDF